MVFGASGKTSLRCAHLDCLEVSDEPVQIEAVKPPVGYLGMIGHRALGKGFSKCADLDGLAQKAKRGGFGMKAVARRAYGMAAGAREFGNGFIPADKFLLRRRKGCSRDGGGGNCRGLVSGSGAS